MKQTIAQRIAAGLPVLYASDGKPILLIAWGVSRGCFWFLTDESSQPHALGLASAKVAGAALAWPGWWLCEAADSEGDIDSETAAEALATARKWMADHAAFVSETAAEAEPLAGT